MDERYHLNLYPKIGTRAVVEHALLQLEADASRAETTRIVVEELAHTSLDLGHAAIYGDRHERKEQKMTANSMLRGSNRSASG